MQRKTKREIGNIGETAVCKFLKQNGYEILDRNFTIRGGEIDIIAKKDNVIAFVEVKTRKVDTIQQGEEAVNKTKQQHIIKAAKSFFETLDDGFSGRFDVAVVEISGDYVKKIKYYVSAFDASAD